MAPFGELISLNNLEKPLANVALAEIWESLVLKNVKLVTGDDVGIAAIDTKEEHTDMFGIMLSDL